MPRVTKRQKDEAQSKGKATGATRGAPPARRRGGKTFGGAGRGGKAGGPRRPAAGGFKVGPAHAPKDAYLGKGEQLTGLLDVSDL
jgi:hypothetical protein